MPEAFMKINDSTKLLILFGCGSLTSLTAHSLTHDAGRTVVAMTVDAAYLLTDRHEGYPVVAFEELVNLFPPDRHDIMLPIGYRRINELSLERFEQAKAMGCHVASYVSSRASVWPDLVVSENVIIFEQAIIQSFVSIGNNAIIRSGAYIGHHSQVGDHAFVASGVVTGSNVTIGERCWIGLGRSCVTTLR